MATVSFCIKSHSIHRDRQVVEVLVGGILVGVIYPDEKNQGIKLVSAHMKEEIEPGFEGDVIVDTGEKSFPPIPSLLVKFRPSSYAITPRGIVRHTS